ncbi:MAG: hypothetical protein F6K36_20350 [Symploca sp. SIO3C6]|uniref:Uncharacterized protein n=1 Tax=Symploca sp. SIO1C4 TaxID=2607765 RepID=A0A6B3NGW5_9CYAN|nr:hypothetical protein [Symploca sp. SIO3C6]NER29274.1 hypothetical protein [Symploca sp. SIO1C4]NET08122.1 hypothetical protein [Symploca sp. SIO2B6]
MNPARIHLIVSIQGLTLVTYTDRHGCHFEVIDSKGVVHRNGRTFASPQMAEEEGRKWVKSVE